MISLLQLMDETPRNHIFSVSCYCGHVRVWTRPQGKGISMIGRLLILLVEDEDVVREIACQALLDAGFDVLEAASALEAFDIIRKRQDLDILFTDIRLGSGPDGWAVADAFREANPDKPILYASGFPAGGSRRISNALFFPKPYNIGKVEAALRVLAKHSGGDRIPPALEVLSAGTRLVRLTYMSRPTSAQFSPGGYDGLFDLAAQCQRLNMGSGLTGALICSATSFIQVLEGEEAPLMAALARISRDSRHDDIRIFELTVAPERLFPNWAMHFSQAEDLPPDLLWRCVESFKHPGPEHAPLLIETLKHSVRMAA